MATAFLYLAIVILSTYILGTIFIFATNYGSAATFARAELKEEAVMHLKAAKQSWTWPYYASLVIGHRMRGSVATWRQVREWEQEDDNN